MASKYFIIDESVNSVAKETIEAIQVEKQQIKRSNYERQRLQAKEKITQEDSLKHVEGRVVIKVDLDSKDSWTFENGMKIEYKRQFNNFNERETKPVNAIVISGEGIKSGSEILVHPNVIHDSNRIFSYKESSDTVKYYSIHNDMCFAWHDGNDWQPLAPYSFALNVFKPYKGLLCGVQPTQLKDTLFVLDGELKNKVVKTIPFSSYVIVFQDKTGREGRIIRFRPFGDTKTKREEEAIAVLETESDAVFSGELIVGVDISDAKQYKTIASADCKKYIE